MEQEMIQVPKETVRGMIKHFEVLIKDFEKIGEQETMRDIDRRLAEIKNGKIKGLSLKDYSEYARKKGVNIG